MAQMLMRQSIESRNCLQVMWASFVASPPLLVNADDVMEIRALAHIFDWTRLEVKSVVRLIRRWTLAVDR